MLLGLFQRPLDIRQIGFELSSATENAPSTETAHPADLDVLLELMSPQLLVVFAFLGELMTSLFKLSFQVHHHPVVIRAVRISMSLTHTAIAAHPSKASCFSDSLSFRDSSVFCFCSACSLSCDVRSDVVDSVWRQLRCGSLVELTEILLNLGIIASPAPIIPCPTISSVSSMSSSASCAASEPSLSKYISACISSSSALTSSGDFAREWKDV